MRLWLGEGVEEVMVGSGGGGGYGKSRMLAGTGVRRDGVDRWVMKGRGPSSFRPNGAVEESLKIPFLSAALLWTRVQPALVSRPEREKLEIWCWAKWAYSSLETVPF